ncbi:MAG: hypothetical protein L6R39_005923 [Caloplaca ligustica]|nr:MAG: hypothetical protein L6R39_005923 [Caloplaca ligustica]
MEHLPLPRDVASPGPSAVPYVCEEEYDGGPFLTYPVRRGMIKTLDAPSRSQYVDFPRLLPKPTAKLEAFIQTWLFFGLLSEFLGEFFVPSQFVSSLDEAPKVLNTNRLVPLVEGWMERIQSLEEDEDHKQAQFDHIAECLQMTELVLQALRPDVQPDLDHRLKACIASIAELFDHAANQAYTILDFKNENKFAKAWDAYYDDPTDSSQMKPNGFCPSKIHRSRQICRTIQTKYFLKWMKRPESGAQHGACSERECRVNRINPGQYKTKHRNDECRCVSVSVHVPELVRILSRGSLPLLWIIPGQAVDDMRVFIVEASPGLKYISLSHVWSDGLGNPVSNTLPRCQLQFLAERIRALPSTMKCGYQGHGVLIWLDTLCCPVEPPEARTMALSQMKTPYSDAAHVLVLDSSLLSVDCSRLDPIEIGLRIFTSGWMGRLWTLQEGALPHNLWFQFKDSAVDIRHAWEQALRIYMSDIGRKGLVSDVMSAYRYLRGFFHTMTVGQAADLCAVHRAIQYRSVSVPADEPLLIGGLLKLDVAYILRGPDSSRMERLWSLMPSAPQGIPKNIIFYPRPRLCRPGFRWAPTSILHFRETRDALLRNPNSRDHEGFLTCAGLQVHLAALIVTMPSVPQGLPKNPWSLYNDRSDTEIVGRDGDGNWFLIRKDPRLTASWESSSGPTLCDFLSVRSRRYVLLLETPFKFHGRLEAIASLLVHHEHDQRVTNRVVSDVIVITGTKQGTIETLLEAAYQASRLLLHDEITTQFVQMAIENEDDQKKSPEYTNLVTSLGQKIRTLAENIDDSDILYAVDVHGTNLFQLFITSAYLGRHYEIGPMLPTDTEWVVD